MGVRVSAKFKLPGYQLASRFGVASPRYLGGRESVGQWSLVIPAGEESASWVADRFGLVYSSLALQYRFPVLIPDREIDIGDGSRLVD